MNPTSLHFVEKLEDHLWPAADNLRANSKLMSSEYNMPVLDVTLLRHATNPYDGARGEITVARAAAKMRNPPLVGADGYHLCEHS